MAEKKKFLLRIDEKIYSALERWAAADLRSINSQIEFLLTDQLKKSNRLKQTIAPEIDLGENDEKESL